MSITLLPFEWLAVILISVCVGFTLADLWWRR